MSRLLIVDDDAAILSTLQQGLETVGHRVVTARSAEQALRAIQTERPEVAILDVKLPDANGLDVLHKLRQLDDQLPVILITGNDDSRTAIEAMKRGALDYLVKPVDLAEIRQVVQRSLQMRNLPVHLSSIAPAGCLDRQAIIGRCPAMQEVYKAIGIVASQNVTVLIRGESGTGKELVARALYQYGERVDRPFLAVNCAAIPETLLESELFGHERGAFTGADRKRIGKFEQCNGGTLFLDEIGDMSPVLQSKLLRVLQEQQFERLGSNQTVRTDVRLIAATNRNLEQMVASNEFRADLYYRLNGFTIYTPPLRDRGDDLELLIHHFHQVISADLRKHVTAISPEAFQLLRQYHWPGNVRELQNALRQGLLKTTGQVLLADFLPDFVRSNQPGQGAFPQVPTNDLADLIDEKIRAGTKQVYEEVMRHVEDQLVTRVLELTKGNRKEAVRLLGVHAGSFRSPAALKLLQLEAGGTSNGMPQVLEPGMTMRQIERLAIRQALRQTQGCRKHAAELLGISVRTMQRKIKQDAAEGLDVPKPT